ncbi:unnamed protein product, partial [Protopolystoma xenopodis]
MWSVFLRDLLLGGYSTGGTSDAGGVGIDDKLNILVEITLDRPHVFPI